MEKEIQITKTLDDQNLVFGYANVAIRKNGETVVDYADDTIAPDDLEQAAYEFVRSYRAANVEHSGPQVGELVECLAITKQKLQAMGLPEDALPQGIWLGFRVNDETFAKVKSGDLKMFSIEGSAQREVLGNE
jgi:hypothetical protein